MRNILLIEKFPLVAIAVRDLINNVYPNAMIDITVQAPKPDLGVNEYQTVFCDLYGDPQEQIEQIRMICSLHRCATHIFISGSIDRAQIESVQDHQSLLLDRTAAYRDIVEAIHQFDNTKTWFNFYEIRNKFQSKIQFPGANKPLTLKQAQIMELCIQGLTGKEIAFKMKLSPETIRAHMRQCYYRLNAKNRPQAIVNFQTASSLAKLIHTEKPANSKNINTSLVPI